MVQNRPNSKTPEGAWLWLYKIVAGILIIVLLGIHFVINHLVAPEGLLSYADVIRYYKVPFVPFMEITFLIFVVSHSLIGIRSIILDLAPSKRILTFVNWAAWLLGAFAITYGIWLVVVIQSKGI